MSARGCGAVSTVFAPPSRRGRRTGLGQSVSLALGHGVEDWMWVLDEVEEWKRCGGAGGEVCGWVVLERIDGVGSEAIGLTCQHDDHQALSSIS